MPIYNVHPTADPRVSAPDLLQHFGLLLTAEVAVSDALAEVLVAQNQAIPPSVPGPALVDTGASICAVDESAALKLGLQPIGQSNVSGVGGTRVHNVYMAKVTFPGTPIPPQQWTLTGADLKDQNLLLLIGRDILRACVLIYNGPGGTCSLRLSNGS